MKKNTTKIPSAGSPVPLRPVFPNLRSRILLGPIFKRQFGLPESPPKILETILRRRERRMHLDLSGIGIDRPVFLFGLPRSGTTIIQDLICSLPQVAYFTNTMNQFRHCFCAAETLRRKLNLNVRGERYIRDSVEVSADSPNDGVAFWGELFGQNLNLEYHPRALADLDPARIEWFRLAIRKALWCGAPASRFFCKLLGVFPYLETVSELFPDACLIHIVRDPRMTANSMLKLYNRDLEQQQRHHRRLRRNLPGAARFVPYPRFPNLADYADRFGLDDIRTTAHLWKDAMNYLEGIRERLPRLLELRYEDFLTRPEQDLARILNFCDLPAPSASETIFRQQIDNVGRVHHKNSYRNFEAIENICAEPMQRYGYI